MLIGHRKLVVVTIIVVVVVLANASEVVTWMQDSGITPLAQHLRAEYFTGMAIVVIAAVLILVPGRTVWATSVRRCPVCDAAVFRQGRYCAECGSRV